MSKKFLISLSGLVVLGGLGFWGYSNWTSSGSIWTSRPSWEKPFSDEELSQRMGRPIGTPTQPELEKVDPKRVVRVAIGNLGLAQDAQHGQVSDLLLAQLTGAKGLEFVERQSFDAVLRELKLSLSGLVRANDAVRVGKLVKADWFMLGSAVTLDGNRHVVVRVVDARTGILRDAGVFQSDQSLTKLAAQLADFLRQCRQNAAEAKSRTYLAVGGFEDLSVNSRQADLPKQLRSYLIAAYQNNPAITLLEREFANTLMQELQLDLAGLTEQSATNKPTPMCSAYWMVDGSYQSYETTEFQVELKLQVRRMFGRYEWFEMREKPGEPLFQGVKVRIDAVIRTNQATLTPTRWTEISAQFSKGEELVPLERWLSGNLGLVLTSSGRQLSGTEVARRRRNTEEAIKAFETVLLLDPNHRRAKMYLAACFRQEFINRHEEGRDIYRQIIDSPVTDQWTELAQKGLMDSFRWHGPEAKRRWFATAAAGTSNPAAKEFYQSHAKRADEDTVIQRGEGKEAEALAEVRLFEYIESFNNLLHNKGGRGSFALGMDSFAEVFDKDRARAVRRLNELYPKMKSQFPDTAPYLLATLLTFQTDTNSPVIGEFERMLEDCAEHPEKVVNGGMVFWSHIRHEPYNWALEQKLTSLAAKIMESIFRAAKVDTKAASILNDGNDKMSLAFSYLALERWKEALVIFESFTNQPVEMNGSGPWGRAFTVVLTGKQAALCRQKLGLPPVIDPREFDFGEPCLHPHSRNPYFDHVTFVAAADGLWLGVHDHVLQLDFDLRTNFIARLPSDNFAAVSTLCVGSSNVWIGTLGGGIFELDKFTRKPRQFTERDGLLMNHISSLHLTGGTLWIGYGNESSGGLGRLDLATRRFASYTPSLSGSEVEGKPPRKQVTAIKSAPNGDIWFMSGSLLNRHRPIANSWETLTDSKLERTHCIVTSPSHLIEAKNLHQSRMQVSVQSVTNGVTNWVAMIDQLVTNEEAAELNANLKTNRNRKRISSGTAGGRPALVFHSFDDGSRRRIAEPGRLPFVPTTMEIDGNNLWLGGAGAVVLMDIDQFKIKKLAYLPARGVDGIQIAGGYAWAWVNFEKHLYRARLP